MLFVLAVVSSMLLYINCVFLVRRIKNDKDIAFNTIGGAILVGIVVYSTLGVIAG